MELLKQLITRILGSGLLSTALVLVRAVTVLMVLYVIWRCYTSFKKGQRRKDPVVMLEDAATGVTLPFISAGGSSMISVWGLLAFLKASDERTYAARRAGRHPKGEADEDTISFTPPRYSPNDPPTPRPRVNTRAENTAPRSRGAYRVHISEENLSPGQSRTRRKDGDRR